MNSAKKTDDELKASQSRLEIAALWSGVAVVAGLVLEVWLAVEYRPVSQPFIHTWGMVFADMLVAGGVFFEILFGRWALRRGAELQERAERLLAVAIERAAEAQERAAVLEREAAFARRRTARLEKAAAWRHLSSDQVKRISCAIRDLALSMNVVIECNRGDPESFQYALEVSDIFKVAGAESVRLNRHSTFPGIPPFGLFFAARPKETAERIVVIFMSAGVSIGLVGINVDEYAASCGTPAANVFVFVAPKPPPTMMIAATRE